MNPAELQIELFCRGLAIDPSCDLVADARHVARTRAGLGSGLELVIPGDLKDLWLNVPVEEDFVEHSPWTLSKGQSGYTVQDRRDERVYPVIVPPEPAWYDAKTSSG
ncbi:MAG: hypothetical protein KDB18_13710, partial [Salinibacterium sp.]|nr:hypothetical protein [Salinibacterium sp.]